MIQNISIDEVIKAIVLQTGLTREQITKKIDETMASFNGLLTQVGAALVIADKMSVKLKLSGDSNQQEGTSGGTGEFLKIKDLIEGMKSINVLGRVIASFPPKEFAKKDGHAGKVAAFVLKDATGTTRVSAWDKEADRISASLKKGDVVGVYNASIKKAFKGNGVEVSTDNRTSIKINPEGVDVSSLPKAGGGEFKEPTVIESFKDAKEDMQYCTFVAKLAGKIPAKAFQKKDGTEGSIGKALLKEDSVIATVVFWTERIPDFDGLAEGTTYKFENVGVKMNNFRNELEFNMTKNSTVTEAGGSATGSE